MKKFLIIASIAISVMIALFTVFDGVKKLKNEVDKRKFNDPTKARAAKAAKPLVNEILNEEIQEDGKQEA